MNTPTTIADIIASLAAIKRAGTIDHGNGCGTVTGEGMLADHVASALAIIDGRLRALEPCPNGHGGGPSHVWEDKSCRQCDLRRPVAVPNASGYGPGEVTVPNASLYRPGPVTVSPREAALDDVLARGRALVPAPMGGAVAAAVAAEADACARIAGDIDAAERAISRAHGHRPVDAYVVHIASIVVADIVERIRAGRVDR